MEQLTDFTNSVIESNIKPLNPNYLYTEYAFTLNNYDDSSKDWGKYENGIEITKAFAKDKCNFLIYSEEVAPTTGTKHLQGHCILKKRTKVNTINRYFNNLISLSLPRHKMKSINYCKKTLKGLSEDERKEVSFEYIAPGYVLTTKNENYVKKNKKNNTEESRDIIEFAKDNNLESIADEYPEVYLDKFIVLQKIRDANVTGERLFLTYGKREFHQNHFIWLYGSSGCGKSYFARNVEYMLNRYEEQIYQRKYLKNEKYRNDPTNLPFKIKEKTRNKYFDGYCGEKIVVIEELSPKTCEYQASNFKQWCDEYPFQAEVKHSSLNSIRPEFIIFTSNYSLIECFPDNRDYSALARRIKEVKFDELPVKYGHRYLNWTDLKLYTYERIIRNKMKKELEDENERIFKEIVKDNDFENIDTADYFSEYENYNIFNKRKATDNDYLQNNNKRKATGNACLPDNKSEKVEEVMYVASDGKKYNYFENL